MVNGLRNHFRLRRLFESFSESVFSLHQQKPLKKKCGSNFFAPNITTKRSLYVTPQLQAVLRLNPQEVNTILQANEYNRDFHEPGPVKSYDSNQLASNNPIEDSRTEAHCLFTSGMLFGVFDGHGGGACAQVVAKRLFHYIAACLLSNEQLDKLSNSLQTSTPYPILQFYNEKFEFVDVLRDLYAVSFRNFVHQIKTEPLPDKSLDTVFRTAFLKLDDDLSREALDSKTNGRLNLKTLSVALSGAVTCVAHVSGPDLHVASAGDCRAVLGVLSENNVWTPRVLSVEHNADNRTEVNRILKDHPKDEQDTVIKYDRLLGQLAPLRAFGDFNYKWPKNILEEHATPHVGRNSVPPHYYTPPYLTALPDVTYHHLTARDKFLVIASDGLWDFISPLQVVRMVGEHMRGKTILTPFSLPKKDTTLSDINKALLVRRESLSMKPTDSNACTHLIRNALGGTEYGLDQSRLSELLSLEQYIVRSYRDDITITVVYFDEEYLRQCLPS